MTSPTRTSLAGIGVVTITEPSDIVGRMLPERTVTVWYRPVRGPMPTARRSRSAHATKPAASSRATAFRMRMRPPLDPQPGRVAPEATQPGPEMQGLLVRGRPLGGVERVGDGRAEVLERVVRRARQGDGH